MLSAIVIALLQSVTPPAPSAAAPAAVDPSVAQQATQTATAVSGTTPAATPPAARRHCHMDTSTGTRLSTHRICTTTEEDNEMHEASRDALDNMTRPMASVPAN